MKSMNALRKFSILIIVVYLTISFILIYLGDFSLFTPSVAGFQDSIQSATQILSTVVQLLSTILSIVLVLLFISAQLTMRESHVRVITEIYGELTNIGILAFYLITIVYSLILMGKTELVVRQKAFHLLDIALLLSSAAVFALLPLLLAEIETLSPLFLIQKIAKRITVTSIKAYGLAQVELDNDGKTVKKCYLERWGHRHGNYDPLGALHDLMMEGVNRKDRMRISAVFFFMLSRVSWITKVPYRRIYGLSSENKQTLLGRLSRNIVDWFTLHLRPCTEENGVKVTLHILHYLVRRTQNFTKEWEANYEALRQITLVILGDFILACTKRKKTDRLIELAVFAIMHICLGYPKKKQWGNYEPIVDLFPIAILLAAQNRKALSELIIVVLAFLKCHTNYIEDKMIHEHISALPQRLQDSFLISIQISSTEGVAKRHWPSIQDPWDYLFEKYRDINTSSFDQTLTTEVQLKRRRVKNTAGMRSFSSALLHTRSWLSDIIRPKS